MTMTELAPPPHRGCNWEGCKICNPQKIEKKMNEYPEHDKLHAIQVESQAQGDFVEWLKSKGIALMTYDSNIYMWQHDQRSLRSLLAEYHNIDEDKLEKEKRAMLARIRGEEK